MKYVICTEQIDPPVPSRHFDWSAWIDGQEERGSCYGPTEADAIRALIEKVLE